MKRTNPYVDAHSDEERPRNKPRQRDRRRPTFVNTVEESHVLSHVGSFLDPDESSVRRVNLFSSTRFHATPAASPSSQRTGCVGWTAWTNS